MTKRALIEALEDFADDDHIILGDEAYSYVPSIKKICGKGQPYMVYYCTKPPGHTGNCYCPCKHVYFVPQTIEEFNALTE